MKNLLLNAVEELVVRANKEINNVKEEIKVVEHMKAKVNKVYEVNAYIENLIYKIELLKDRLEIDFPEEIDKAKEIEKQINIIKIQIEDVLNIAYEVGNEILEVEC